MNPRPLEAIDTSNRPRLAALAANAMSDHAVQIDENAQMVSQNIQGPYAIKKNRRGMWVFDAPEITAINAKRKNQVLRILRRFTGLSGQACEALCDALIADNQQRGLGPSRDANAVRAFFQQQIKNNGIGDPLGQGGFRFCIETHQQFQKRTMNQISLLKACTKDEPEVLCIQEQPYELNQDTTRRNLFKNVMYKHGFVQASTPVAGRDVGIWVKKNCLHAYSNVTNDKHLKALAEKVGLADNFRGSIVQKQTAIYVNLHTDRKNDTDAYIADLCALKKCLESYAQQQNPKAQIIISGDMNLFQLTQTQRTTLQKAGFTVVPVKNQERSPTPTCEAYHLAARPVPKINAAAKGADNDITPQSGNNVIKGQSNGSYRAKTTAPITYHKPGKNHSPYIVGGIILLGLFISILTIALTITGILPTVVGIIAGVAAVTLAVTGIGFGLSKCIASVKNNKNPSLTTTAHQPTANASASHPVNTPKPETGNAYFNRPHTKREPANAAPAFTELTGKASLIK